MAVGDPMSIAAARERYTAQLIGVACAVHRASLVQFMYLTASGPSKPTEQTRCGALVVCPSCAKLRPSIASRLTRRPTRLACSQGGKYRPRLRRYAVSRKFWPELVRRRLLSRGWRLYDIPGSGRSLDQ
jgi:hypothetical protein